MALSLTLNNDFVFGGYKKIKKGICEFYTLVVHTHFIFLGLL